MVEVDGWVFVVCIFFCSFVSLKVDVRSVSLFLNEQMHDKRMDEHLASVRVRRESLQCASHVIKVTSIFQWALLALT
jgi:hypothetical protein